LLRQDNDIKCTRTERARKFLLSFTTATNHGLRITSYLTSYDVHCLVSKYEAHVAPNIQPPAISIS